MREKEKLRPGKKLFVLRNSTHRNLLNINELASLAHEHNFELLQPELLTFREQAQAFFRSRDCDRSDWRLVSKFDFFKA